MIDADAFRGGMQHPTDDLALSIIPGKFPEFTIYSTEYVRREMADITLDRSAAGEEPDDDFEEDGNFEQLAGVLGYLQVYKDDTRRWYVTRVVASEGYGPLLYAIAAEYARTKGAIIIPSDSLSNAARRLWDKFDRNPYVTIVENGKSHTGFGVVGNGTLNLEPAVSLDERVKQDAGDNYGMILGYARDWCEVTMDGLWDYDEEAAQPCSLSP